MTNTVPGIVSFRTPVFLTGLKMTGVEHYDNVQKTGPMMEIVAVRGTWTNSATGTDGIMTVTDVLPKNEDELRHLNTPVQIALTLASGFVNVTAIQ